MTHSTIKPNWPSFGGYTPISGCPEFRVRLNRPISRIRLLHADEAMPPLPVKQQPKVIAPPPLPEPIRELPPAEVRTLFETDIGKEIAQDRKKIESVLQSVTKEWQAACDKQHLHVHELQQAAIELALTIATKLLHRDIEEDRFEIETILEEMTIDLEPSRNATIRLNPDDYDLLQTRMEGSMFQLPTLPDAIVVPDELLARGTCQIDTGDTILVSDFNTQLQQMRDQLLGELGHARS
jgi:hypothetical protein